MQGQPELYSETLFPKKKTEQKDRAETTFPPSQKDVVLILGGRGQEAGRY